MTKQDYINGYAKREGITQIEARKRIESMEEYNLAVLLADGVVPFMGKIELQETKERIGRNPKNPTETHVIPAGRKIKYKPSTFVKESIK